MEYIAAFFTHSGAIKYQNHLRRKNVEVELRPVPRQLSSSCGIAGQFKISGDIALYISEDLEKVFRITAEGYELVYESD